MVAGAVAHGLVTVWWVGVLAAASRRHRLGPWRGALAGAAIAALDLGVVAPRRAPAIAELPRCRSGPTTSPSAHSSACTSDPAPGGGLVGQQRKDGG